MPGQAGKALDVNTAEADLGGKWEISPTRCRKNVVENDDMFRAVRLAAILEHCSKMEKIKFSSRFLETNSKLSMM